MARPKKPYFSITIVKPEQPPAADAWTSADLRYGCGRLRIKVADNYPDAASLINRLAFGLGAEQERPDMTWSGAVRRVAAFAKLHGEDCTLSYPTGWSLWDEEARLNAPSKAPVEVSGG